MNVISFQAKIAYHGGYTVKNTKEKPLKPRAKDVILIIKNKITKFCKENNRTYTIHDVETS